MGPVRLFRMSEYARTDLQQFDPNVEFLLRHFLENYQIQTAALYSVQYIRWSLSKSWDLCKIQATQEQQQQQALSLVESPANLSRGSGP